MPLNLSDFDAVTFDVYGTLIDWEPAIIGFLRDWTDRNSISPRAQDLLMAFDLARAEIQKERPAHLYPDVLRRCFDRISAAGLSRQPCRSEGSAGACPGRGIEQHRQCVARKFMPQARLPLRCHRDG